MRTSLTSGTSSAVVDGPNTFVVEVRGDNMKFWANGSLVSDFTDARTTSDAGFTSDPIPYGGVGVSWVWESLGWIDDVNVEALQ